MTKFRLTIGENLTPWGKQQVLREFEAKNAIEFVKDACHGYSPADILIIRKNAWVDAGSNTIPIAVRSLNF